jgi:hypothetical protein
MEPLCLASVRPLSFACFCAFLCAERPGDVSGESESRQRCRRGGG